MGILQELALNWVSEHFMNSETLSAGFVDLISLVCLGFIFWAHISWSLRAKTRFKLKLRLVSFFALLTGLTAVAHLQRDYRNSHLEIVQGQSFVNQRVNVDGKDFRNCRFMNVTFFTNGTGSWRMDESNGFPGVPDGKGSEYGTIGTGTNDPRVRSYIRLKDYVDSIARKMDEARKHPTMEVPF